MLDSNGYIIMAKTKEIITTIIHNALINLKT